MRKKKEQGRKEKREIDKRRYANGEERGTRRSRIGNKKIRKA